MLLVCRNCQRPRTRKSARGLCWKCYHKPEVKEKFPPQGKFANRGSNATKSIIPLPDEPTKALPGTDGKILVLTQRAALGQQLFHPNDYPSEIV